MAALGHQGHRLIKVHVGPDRERVRRHDLADTSEGRVHVSIDDAHEHIPFSEYPDWPRAIHHEERTDALFVHLRDGLGNRGGFRGRIDLAPFFCQDAADEAEHEPPRNRMCFQYMRPSSGGLLAKRSRTQGEVALGTYWRGLILWLSHVTVFVGVK